MTMRMEKGEPKSSKPFIEHYREQGMNVYSVTTDTQENDDHDPLCPIVTGIGPDYVGYCQCDLIEAVITRMTREEQNPTRNA